MAPQDSCSKSGDPVGPAPSLGFKPFNETTVNQSVQSGVERSRGKVNAPESLDVLRQGVAMLGPFCKAAQNECRWAAIAPKLPQLISHEGQP